MIWLSFCFAIFIFVSALLLTRTKSKRAALPPGPRGLPFLGNLLDIPKVKPWLVYDDWSRVYGDVMHFKIFSRHFIILNSLQSTLDLLEKKSAAYSDRPVFVMAGELVGRNNSVLFSHYGERLRTYRRLLHAALNPNAAREYWPLQEAELHRFMKRLLNTPEDMLSLIRSYAGAVVLRIAYGHRVEPGHDRFVELAEELAHITTDAIRPGRWMVDSFPWLSYVPKWFPGAGFRVWAENARRRSDEIMYAPIEMVKRQLAAGTAQPSFTSKLIEPLFGTSGPVDEQENAIIYTASSFYAAGADTTASVLATFFLMMTLHPDVQHKAQAEIDALLSQKRLPTMSDRKSLPYVEAIIQEVYRFHPVAPLVLHCPLEDDVYKGHFIPKGASVFANIWAILHDERMFPQPNLFRPERFIGSDHSAPLDPRTVIFGFGRRVCPGQHLGDASVFLAITTCLATLFVTKHTDESGVEEDPVIDFTSGHTSHALPYRCKILARSVGAVELINQAVNAEIDI